MTMTQDDLKKAVAQAALSSIEDDMVVGVGTGSTVNYFIEALATCKHRIDGAVASSEATAARLKQHGIRVLELNTVGDIPIYIDGADEATTHKQLIKGGGGALTREKILAAVAKKFICIIDETKQVDVLGHFPLPVEVIPMARSYVGRQIVKLGGEPMYREGFVTDNHNIIIAIHNLDILDPIKIEQQLNQITGVVCNGLFALRPADVLLVATATGVKKL